MQPLIAAAFTVAMAMAIGTIFAGRQVEFERRVGMSWSVALANHRRWGRRLVMAMVIALGLTEVLIRAFHVRSSGPLFIVHLCFAITSGSCLLAMHFFTGLKDAKAHRILAYSFLGTFMVGFITGLVVLFRTP